MGWGKLSYTEKSLQFIIKVTVKMRKSKSGLTDQDRMLIIEEHLNGASFYSLGKKYKIARSSVIKDWMITFGILTKEKEIMPKVSKGDESEELKALLLENKRLKKALAEERLRSTAYDKMIDVAEEMFRIPIRKKPDTKQ